MKNRKRTIKRSALCLFLFVMSLSLTGCGVLLKNAANTPKDAYTDKEAQEIIGNYTSEEKKIFEWVKENTVNWLTLQEYTDAEAVEATEEITTMINAIENDYGSTFYDFSDISNYVDEVEFVSYSPDFHPNAPAVEEENALLKVNIKCSDGNTYSGDPYAGGIQVEMNDDGETVDTSEVYEKAIVASYATQYVSRELAALLNAKEPDDFTIRPIVYSSDFDLLVTEIFVYDDECGENLANKKPLKDLSELDGCIYVDVTISIDSSMFYRKTPDEVMAELNQWKEEHQINGKIKLEVTYSSEDVAE